MFFGDGAASTTATWAGHVGAAMDIRRWPRGADAKKNAFDFLSTSGFGFLECD